MPKRVPEVGFYYHYKHDTNGPLNDYAYEFIGVGFHTEEDCRVSERHFAFYRPLYMATVYSAEQILCVPCFDARPLEMWMDEVDKKGVRVPRFQKITDPVVIAQLEKVRAEMYP